MPIGAISINKNTNGRFRHREWLESKGFSVEETTILKTRKGQTREQAVYLVQVDGFIKDDIDLSNLDKMEAVQKFRSLTTNREDGLLYAITYQTKVRLPGEAEFSKGIPLTGKLGPASALMMTEYEGQVEKPTQTSNGFDW